MRMINYLLILCIIAVLSISCTNQEKRIKELWMLEDSINYQDFTEDEKEKIEELLERFSLEEKRDRTNWKSGYSQQCYVLRKLYFEEIISQEVFLNRCISVYSRYESNQSDISFHTMGYAVCLYYAGQKKKATELLKRIENKANENDFSSKEEYEISFGVCHKLLTDTSHFYMSDEDIINTFCGN